jgi:hypothetical protein
MGYFSELDLKLRQYLPEDVDRYIPACPHTHGQVQIIGFVPPKTLQLACPSCNQRFQYRVHIKTQIVPEVESSRYEPSETETNIRGTQNGNPQRFDRAIHPPRSE